MLLFPLPQFTFGSVEFYYWDRFTITTASREDQREWLESIELMQDSELKIFQTLLDYQLNPASISANVFPMLAVANDLKEIVREFGLDASKVRELNKLSAEKLNLDAVAAARVRSQAAWRVATENLSLSETRELVGDLLKTRNADDSAVRSPSQRVIRSLQSISVEDWQTDEIKALKQG